ncbi:L,D-transpeptidase [Nocardioides sp. YIM 152588]|uniref:L,D-transpeptidase n=1 Tax=Nocardioides sp. YIM 152588 TaxID=3158259 RepID=UPI0032E43CEA
MGDTTSAPEPGNRGASLLIAVLACVALIVAVRAYGVPGQPDTGSSAEVVDGADIDLASLTATTTEARIKAAPVDGNPDQAPDGLVVHPKRAVPVFDVPDGTAIAKVGPHQFGDTWLPVVDRQRGWVQVLLPSRPNGSTGWLRAAGLQRAHSRFLVRVHLGSRTMGLYENGAEIGSWPVAVGAGDTPTPTGRTFLLGQMVDDQQSFSPLILPLGTHSPTLDSYGGGPGTVAIHGWTDASVFGKAVSHGCIRVPDEALAELRSVPLGTAVLIDEA